MRSIVKGVSWRVVATLTTISLVFFLTGNLYIAFSVGFIEIFAKLLFYYLHERVWNRIEWGKVSNE